jgi:hypothetical protein
VAGADDLLLLLTQHQTRGESVYHNATGVEANETEIDWNSNAWTKIAYLPGWSFLMLLYHQGRRRADLLANLELPCHPASPPLVVYLAIEMPDPTR